MRRGSGGTVTDHLSMSRKGGGRQETGLCGQPVEDMVPRMSTSVSSGSSGRQVLVRRRGDRMVESCGRDGRKWSRLSAR